MEIISCDRPIYYFNCSNFYNSISSVWIKTCRFRI